MSTTAASRGFTTSASAQLYLDAASRLGDITPENWPDWKILLPDLVASMTGIVGVEDYLEGDVTRPDYDATTRQLYISVAGINTPEGIEFMRWLAIAKSLRQTVSEKGGKDAMMRVKNIDVKLGDAPALWKKLDEWYGQVETGAQKIVWLNRLVTMRWDEGNEKPEEYFAKLDTLREQLNNAYQVELNKHPKKNDPLFIADQKSAIPSYILRDLIAALLPNDYSNILLHTLDSTSTLESLRKKINIQYENLDSREQIQANEQARANALLVKLQQSHSQSQSYPVQNAPPQSYSNQRGSSSRGGRNGKRQYKTVNVYPGYEKWRGGTFTMSDGRVRFNIPVGTC
ncbi:hypothetical protein JCM5353_000447, partial [Sporobolomyces roseus]